MKKFYLIVASMLIATLAFAQGPMGGPPRGGGGPRGGGFPMGAMFGRGANSNVDPVEYAKLQADTLVTLLSLQGEQAEKVYALNEKYSHVPGPFGLGESNPMADFANRNFEEMTEEERQKMMNDAMSRMDDMQKLQDQAEANTTAYEDELSQILDKKQFKAYKKDKRQKEVLQQRRMEAMMRSRMGGFGGPGGGGFGGGGFGGGGFGGPGGF